MTLGNNIAEATATSADGSVIVGNRGNSGDNDVAFIWDSINGMQDLQEVLSDDFGLNLEVWELINATGISADGRTIVGYGLNPQGHTEAWWAVVPEPSTLHLAILTSLGLVGYVRRRTMKSASSFLMGRRRRRQAA